MPLIALQRSGPVTRCMRGTGGHSAFAQLGDHAVLPERAADHRGLRGRATARSRRSLRSVRPRAEADPPVPKEGVTSYTPRRMPGKWTKSVDYTRGAVLREYPVSLIDRGYAVAMIAY